MAKKIPLEHQGFLQEVAKLMFSNPFNHSIAEVEALTGSRLGEGCDEHFYVLLKPQLEQTMQALAEAGITRLDDIDNASDRHIFTAAGLFLVYDGCIDELDDLITRQLAEPEKVIKAPFYKKVFNALNSLGFDEEKTARYFALFFQLRRAYLFINRELTGGALCIAQLRRELWNNIFTSDALLYVDNLWNRMEDFSTLLLGETGTGKGAAAKAIGYSGLIPFDESTASFKAKFTDAFVAINLLEFPETLLESELFGHTKGAFTGAVMNYDGLFKRCNAHGSLFLDEIGDTNTSIQIKLLKVLQERQFTPVGSHQTQRFAGRVIAATNRDLNSLRDSGEFRDDFYYRLSSDVISLPTLRERLAQAPEELAVLVTSLVERLTGQPSTFMAKKVLAQLEASVPQGYNWPGNVRELEQAVRRTILGRPYTGDSSQSDNMPSWLSEAVQGEVSAAGLLSGYCTMLYERFNSYEKVAAITELDRRTVKKYIE